MLLGQARAPQGHQAQGAHVPDQQYFQHWPIPFASTFSFGPWPLLVLAILVSVMSGRLISIVETFFSSLKLNLKGHLL